MKYLLYLGYDFRKGNKCIGYPRGDRVAFLSKQWSVIAANAH